MGCNCGQTKAQQDFVYTDGDGNQTVYRTEIEARAAQIRSGGKGTIKTQPR